jgi:hypothetical protein
MAFFDFFQKVKFTRFKYIITASLSFFTIFKNSACTWMGWLVTTWINFQDLNIFLLLTPVYNFQKFGLHLDGLVGNDLNKFSRFKYFLAADSSLQFSKIQPALGWVGW